MSQKKSIWELIRAVTDRNSPPSLLVDGHVVARALALALLEERTHRLALEKKVQDLEEQLLGREAAHADAY